MEVRRLSVDVDSQTVVVGRLHRLDRLDWVRARATDALETHFVPTNEVWDPGYESKPNFSSSDPSSGRAKQQDRGWSNQRQP